MQIQRKLRERSPDVRVWDDVKLEPDNCDGNLMKHLEICVEKAGLLQAYNECLVSNREFSNEARRLNLAECCQAAEDAFRLSNPPPLA